MLRRWTLPRATIAAMMLLAVSQVAIGAGDDPEQSPPANDDFGRAKEISTPVYLDYGGDAAGATFEEYEPAGCPGPRARLWVDVFPRGSIWYRFTPQDDVLVTVDAQAGDTELGVYTGARLAVLREIACAAENRGVEAATLSFMAKKGVTYHLRVAYRAGEIDADLKMVPTPFLGSISGRVTSEDGVALPDMCVTPFGVSLTPNFRVRTDDAGRYAAYRDTGSYIVLFDDCRANREYSFEYYDDRLFAEDADRILLLAPLAVENIDARLSLAGAMSGRVTDEETRHPLPRICVTADMVNEGRSFIGPSSYSRTWAQVETDAGGRYEFPALPSNLDYKVYFYACYDGGHVSEWYDDKYDESTADRVHILPGQRVARIDAVLRPVPAQHDSTTV